uniref:ATP-dependent DNA helicase n=1 Tax=Zea mays TaxID=4577 RepID=A0A804N2H0_MAIZE
MEDPTYSPEVVQPTADATKPDGSSVTACNWVIPEFVRTPFPPASTPAEVVGSFDMSTESIRRKHHVLRGERQAILAHRNQQFQASIARNVTTSNGDTIGDAEINNNDEETSEDIEIDGTQHESTGTDVPDPYKKVYNNLPEETHMLKPVPNCGYCTGKKFEYEPPGFCCRGGKVDQLAPLDTPPQLRRLWDSADSDAKHFRDNIRFLMANYLSLPYIVAQ